MIGTARLRALSQGFRDRLLRYEELTVQVRAWADAFPELVSLRSLATTPEGRELWMLTLGGEPDRARPSVWVDGNIHASELCGSSVALAIAEDVLALHLDPDADLHGLGPEARATVREVRVFVLPRMSPDGAEKVLELGNFVRSVPRDTRPGQSAPYWISEDVDGDGLALVMRVEDPTGEYVESRAVPNLMVQRSIDDPPPYYKLLPEGRIVGWDGRTVPTPSYIQDNYPDLNRNFPWSWAPEHEQVGAGDHPGSEIESRAVIEFASSHPELFAWLNLHTFGGVHIRPLGHEPDNKMDPSDLALYRQIEKWGDEHTAYPMVSGFEEFTYEPDRPIRGDLSEWAYGHRGCVAWVTELWDVFEQAGLPRPKRFVERYTKLDRAEVERLAEWDAEHNAGRVIRPWKKVDHPQLGRVEVGGLDPRIGFWNPPPEKMPGICAGASALWLRVCALAPRVTVRDPVVRRPLGDGLTRVEITVDNLGYLPTYVLSSAKKLAHSEPLWAEATAGGGCALVELDDARREIGHLDGWGRGLYDGSNALYLMRSRGRTGTRQLTWVLRGSGTLSVRIGSCRVGWIEKLIEV
jgi:hypothetical protein